MARKKKRWSSRSQDYPRILYHPGGTIAVIHSSSHARTIGRDYRPPTGSEISAPVNPW